MSKELLFSITSKDFEIQTFKAGGKGGQYQNKTESGVRIIHKDSGAVGESRDSRSQAQNRKTAFNRLIETDTFKKWHRLECAKRLGDFEDVEDWVEKQLSSENISVDVVVDGKWVKEKQ